MKKYLIIALIFISTAQLYVPAKMIFDREKVLAEGKSFKFKTSPIDPNDPFRGKYITLNFEANSYLLPDTTQSWNYDEDAYVLLEENDEGFAEVKEVVKEKPSVEIDYVKAKVSSPEWDHRIFIYYPFNRFYLGEYKAPEAEEVYRQAIPDSTKTTYALVKIKNGEAVIADVLIDEESIKSMVNKNEDNLEN